MDSHNFEFEEFDISESIGHTFKVFILLFVLSNGADEIR